MKKRTLNQTWILCIRMWRWIVKNLGKGRGILGLKKQWLSENGFKDVKTNCFFCDFVNTYSERLDCSKCPGTLIDPAFHCMNSAYDYSAKSGAFLEELLRLNRIRKGKK